MTQRRRPKLRSRSRAKCGHGINQHLGLFGFGDYPEVVRDEEVAQLELALQLVEHRFVARAGGVAGGELV